MGNSLLTTEMITKESLRVLKNQLGFTKGVNRQYDSQFAQSGAKKGDTINIRKPVRSYVSDGAALVIQDQEDESVPLVLDKHKHIGFQFSDKDLTLSIEEFSARYITPKVISLANQIDLDGLALYKNVWNAVGVPETTPATFLVAMKAKQKLMENGCPMDDQLSLVLNPAAEALMVDALKGLFNSSEQVKKQYEKGMMGIAAGFKWKMDQNVNTHVTGAQGGTPEVKTTVSTQGATVIATEAWTSAAANRLKVGDVFTVAGVYSVNPQSKQSTGSLQQFVVTADFDSDSSGEGDISVQPAMYTTGAKQNISAFPVDGALITVLDAASAGSNSTPANMAYHRDAFVLGCADFELPKGVDMAGRATDPDAGLSISFVRQYDINMHRRVCRLDVIYGWKAVYPELACRIQG